MRRLLSWIVLILLSFAFMQCEYWLWILVKLIYMFIYKLSPILFWVLVVSGGLTLVYYAIFVIALAVQYLVKITQSVHHTIKGTRYKVVGILSIILFSLNLISTVIFVIKDITANEPIVQIVSSITMIGFGIYLVSQAKQIAIDDGAPLSKKERLQARLAKIEEKERINNQ